MWGIVPAAGKGSRIQPLAFSKELLPVGGRYEGTLRRPRAVSDYLMERLALGGVTRVCFVISPGKSDILEYYGGSAHAASICYSVQPQPAGLCDAIFRALPFVDLRAPVLIGLPDTIWFPADALAALPNDQLSLLLFPVERPEYFDAVVLDSAGRVQEIEVKRPDAHSHWIWGAFKMPGATLESLFHLWCERGRTDEYFGTLLNAWMDNGGQARGVKGGTAYIDVGTLDGYFEAMQMLAEPEREAAIL